MQLPLFEPVPVIHSVPVKKRSGRGKTSRDYSVIRNEWQTPQEIIDHAIVALGAIDLNPCSNGTTDLTIPARMNYLAEDDSLSRPWQGRTWLNPPYNRAIGPWIDKLCSEYEMGGVTAAIALVPARTDTPWWQRLSAYPYCAIRDRLKFVRSRDGKKVYPSHPSVVVYLGPQLARFATAFADIGTIYIPYNS